MQATKLTCPDCNATLQTAKPIPPGAKIKCPKCGSTFAVPAATNGSPSAVKPTNRIAATNPPSSLSKKSRPIPKADVDDDEDIDDRPRKKKKKFKSRKEAGSGAILWVTLGVVFVLLAGGGFLTYYLINSNSNSNVAKNTDTGAAGAPNPLAGNPGRPNRPPFDPSNPPNRPPFGPGNMPGRPPMQPPNFGGGNFNPLASIDFTTLDFGDLPTKQVSQFDAVKYLPASSAGVVGLDVGGLASNPTIAGLTEGPISQVLAQMGLPLENIDHVVVSAKANISKVAAEKNQRPVVIVIKTKAKYDQVKLRQATNASEELQIAGKTVYRINDKSTVFYLPSDRIIVASSFPENELPEVVNVKGDQAIIPADMLAMIGKLGQAHGWMVMGADALKADAASDSPDIPKELANAMGNARGAGLTIRLKGKQVTLAGSVFCEDGDASKKLVGGLQTMWSLMGNAVLEKVKTQIPNLAQLATDVQKTQFKSQGDLAQVTLDVNFASLAPLAKMSQSDWADLGSSLASMANQGGGGGGVAQNPGNGERRRPRLGGDDQPPPDAPGSGGSTDENAKEGFEVGNRLPEISGKDTDNKVFKLSDYRGKVVLLDFWGHW